MYELRLSIRTAPAELRERVEPYVAERWIDAAGQPFGYAWRQGLEHGIRIHNVGFFVTRRASFDVTGYPDEGVPPRYFRDVFFHTVARWLLQAECWDCLHGSSVLTESGVVALCGPPDRGKSTLARAWTERGVTAYADDAVPFLVRDGIVMAARLPQRPRLHGPAALLFRDSPSPAGTEAEADEANDCICNLEKTLRPLAALYWLEPQSCGLAGGTIIEQLHASEAFPLVIGEAHFLSFDDVKRNRKMVANYLELVQSVPVFRLCFEWNLDALFDVVARLAEHQRMLAGFHH